MAISGCQRNPDLPFDNKIATHRLDESAQALVAQFNLSGGTVGDIGNTTFETIRTILEFVPECGFAAAGFRMGSLDGEPSDREILEACLYNEGTEGINSRDLNFMDGLVVRMEELLWNGDEDLSIDYLGSEGGESSLSL